MLKNIKIPIIMLSLVFLAGILAATVSLAAAATPGDRLTVAGMLQNPQGKGVKEVEVEVLVNGQPIKPTGQEEGVLSGKSGSFVGEFLLPAGTLPGAKVEVKAIKPSWEPLAATPVNVVEAGADAAGNKLFQASAELQVEAPDHPGLLDRHPDLAAGLLDHLLRMDAPHPGGPAGRGPDPVHHLYPWDL